MTEVQSRYKAHHLEREKQPAPAATSLHTLRTNITSIGNHNTTTATHQLEPGTIKQHTSNHDLTRIGA
jgi:hypothetical protein